MVKRPVYTLLTILFLKFAAAQQSYKDSLLHKISIEENDTARLILSSALTEEYIETKADSSLYYADKTLETAEKLNLKLEQVFALAEKGYSYLNMGNYPRSLQIFLSAIAIAEDPKSEQNILPAQYPPPDDFTNRHVTPHKQRLDKLARIHQYMGILYSNNANYEKALAHFLKTRQLTEQTGNLRLSSINNITVGRAYLALHKPDSALMAGQRAYDQAMQVDYKRYLGSILLNLGRIHVTLGHAYLARDYFRKALAASKEFNYYRGVIATSLILSDYYKQSGKKDSTLFYIKDALTVADKLNAPDLLLRSYTAFADYYRTINNSDSAVKYQSLIIKLNDSLFNSKQTQQFQNIDFDEQQRQQQIETAKAAYRVKLRMYILLAGLATFLFIAIVFWRNNRQRQKANTLLSMQKEELEKALSTLKATQAQLIQSEKMASLGELTAGIAHEIQNPLNFVNNFSEVNMELIDEMEQQLNSGNLDELRITANNIKENEQKINHHGKRADAIVKGMLQHSRTSSAVKEPTDINNLVGEYLRLAYHGIRAKDNFFNATIKTDYDERIGNINTIPQDIGRVILNLITNAFYAVTEKKKQAGDGYEPMVAVITKKMLDKVQIRVRDNGNGISQKLMDKIFQPFFTTKPTGEGTGLGLSLSYDIIKAHGGELKAETKEGSFSEFIITLPGIG
jgi:signal transduction histidine kinase